MSTALHGLIWNLPLRKDWSLFRFQSHLLMAPVYLSVVLWSSTKWRSQESFSGHYFHIVNDSDTNISYIQFPLHKFVFNFVLISCITLNVLKNQFILFYNSFKLNFNFHTNMETPLIVLSLKTFFLGLLLQILPSVPKYSSIPTYFVVHLSDFFLRTVISCSDEMWDISIIKYQIIVLSRILKHLLVFHIYLFSHLSYIFVLNVFQTYKGHKNNFVCIKILKHRTKTKPF
jgi:hypothetical protein